MRVFIKQSEDLFIVHSNPGYVLIIMAGIGVVIALFTKVKK